MPHQRIDSVEPSISCGSGGIGVIVNYDISVSDGKTTSVEQNNTSVQFKGTAEQNKKSQDSLQEKNKQRASVKELYEKPN